MRIMSWSESERLDELALGFGLSARPSGEATTLEATTALTWRF